MVMPSSGGGGLSPEAQKAVVAELLKQEAIQRVLTTLQDIILGKKRLVIQSLTQRNGSPEGLVLGYRHTFHVEDIKDEEGPA